MASLVVDYNEYGKWYNVWRDECAKFVAEYRDHQSLYTVATTVVRLIESGLNKPYEDPNHAFLRYGTDEKVFEENIHTLAMDVMAEIQTPSLRQYVVSFFHSAGANHDDLAELFELFLDFRDNAVFSDDDDEEDEEDENDEEEEAGEEDEVEEGQIQWSWGPNQVQSASDWVSNPNGLAF
jgi:hypothetical protein